MGQLGCQPSGHFCVWGCLAQQSSLFPSQLCGCPCALHELQNHLYYCGPVKCMLSSVLAGSSCWRGAATPQLAGSVGAKNDVTAQIAC